MNKRGKIIAGAAVLGVLALIAIYLNFFTGSSSIPNQDEAMKAADEAAKSAAPVEPPPPSKEPQVGGLKKRGG
jgi:hypothetical protein